MHTETYSLEGFADRLQQEASRGIVDGKALMELMQSRGIPTKIFDVRGALRLALEKVEDGIEVTTYNTPLSAESLLQNISLN